MRVAAFFTPPADHPLTRAAAAWLGRDAFTGKALAQEVPAEIDAAELRELTAFPRRYGFHGTLKPPFAIAAGRDIGEIEDRLAAFCEGRPALQIRALRIGRLGAFFALVPAHPTEALDRLAGDLVRTLDVFRAPPSAEEIARRNPEDLSERQRAHLARWGYPYVFEDFRFHMTLTGPVPEDRREVLDGLLQERFEPFLDRPLMIDAVSLFAEPDPPGDFVVRLRRPLAEPLAVAGS